MSPEQTPTTHYVFRSSDPEQATLTSIPMLDEPLDNWAAGERFNVDVPKDLVFEIDEDHEGTMIPFFNHVIPLMRTDLLQALRAAGVDNIDDYPALIRETGTGREYTDYRAVNIIGAVSAADMGASDVEASSFDDEAIIDAFFHRLQIDEAAAEGLLFFRLAEKVTTILVHARVRDHLLKTGIESLSFVHPAEWSG